MFFAHRIVVYFYIIFQMRHKATVVGYSLPRTTHAWHTSQTEYMTHSIWCTITITSTLTCTWKFCIITLTPFTTPFFTTTFYSRLNTKCSRGHVCPMWLPSVPWSVRSAPWIWGWKYWWGYQTLTPNVPCLVSGPFYVLDQSTLCRWYSIHRFSLLCK